MIIHTVSSLRQWEEGKRPETLLPIRWVENLHSVYVYVCACKFITTFRDSFYLSTLYSTHSLKLKK